MAVLGKIDRIERGPSLGQDSCGRQGNQDQSENRANTGRAPAPLPARQANDNYSKKDEPAARRCGAAAKKGDHVANYHVAIQKRHNLPIAQEVARSRLRGK